VLHPHFGDKPNHAPMNRGPTKKRKKKKCASKRRARTANARTKKQWIPRHRLPRQGKSERRKPSQTSTPREGMPLKEKEKAERISAGSETPPSKGAPGCQKNYIGVSVEDTLAGGGGDWRNDRRNGGNPKIFRVLPRKKKKKKRQHLTGINGQVHREKGHYLRKGTLGLHLCGEI